MAERVVEAALAVRSPGHFVILDTGACGGSSCGRARNEAVRVIHEYLYARARDSESVRAALSRVARVDLVQEERGAIDLKSGDTTQVPELCRAERVLVPRYGDLGVGHDQHHGDARAASRLFLRFGARTHGGGV